MTQVTVVLNAQAQKMGVLLNAGIRRARALEVPCHVVYIETPSFSLRGNDHKESVLRFMTEAEEKEAHIHRIEASSLEEGLSLFLSELNDSVELFIGKLTAHNKATYFSKSLKDKLKERFGKRIIMHFISMSARSPTIEARYDVFRLRAVRLHHIIYALLSVLAAFLATEVVRLSMSVAEFNATSYNASVIFMMPPIIMALRFGVIPGLVAALFSFLTMNYFYIRPIHRLDISDLHDMINMLLYFSTAIIMTLLGSYSFAHSESIRRRERRTRALFSLNEVISQSNDREEALENIHATISELLEMQVAIFLPPILSPNDIQLSYPNDKELFNVYDWDAIKDTWNFVRPAGCGTPRYGKSRWRFEPMITGQDRFGVLGIHIPPKCDIDAAFGQLVAALADQAGNILERIELSKEVEAKRISEEREKLRSMLLSSVSHDLKTPLASIIGSLSVYHGMFDALPDNKKRELTETALDEAQRLDSFITNILDMTRIESGHVELKQDPANPEEIVRRVAKRLQQRLKNHQLQIIPPQTPVEIQIDLMMTEQIIQNLLDNAAKYTPNGSEIFVHFQEAEAGYQIQVRDTGAGIPEDKYDSVFDKYERLRQKDSKVAGTGLGLAITKAIMEAQKGSITVQNHEEGGAVFTLTFPEYSLQTIADKERA